MKRKKIIKRLQAEVRQYENFFKFFKRIGETKNAEYCDGFQNGLDKAIALLRRRASNL